MPKFLAAVSALATMTGRIEVEADTPEAAAALARSLLTTGDYDPDWEFIDRGRPAPGSAAVDTIRDEDDTEDLFDIRTYATRAEKVQAALERLLHARDLLKSAGASPRLLAKVRLAISSAKGAARHAENKDMGDYLAARQAEEDMDREVIARSDGTLSPG